MAQILVRDLDDEVVDKLKERAKSAGRSLQSEVKRILEQAAEQRQVDREAALKRILELRRRFKGVKFPDSAELIRQERDARER